MFIQNQIKRTLSTPESTAYIKHLLENEDILHRTDLAKRVCQQFEFYDTRGRVQLSGCVKALRQLEKAGHIILPRVERKEQTKKSPRRLPEGVPLPVDVPQAVEDVQDLRLVLVCTDEEMRIWNECVVPASVRDPLTAG